MTDGDWNYDALYIDGSLFDGNTARVAFRHRYNGGVTGVMIDELSISTNVCLRAEVSFDLNVSAGDTIAFELYCNGSDILYHEGRQIVLYAEGYGELIRIDAYEFASEHGLRTWTPVSVTVPFGGQVTFRIVEEGHSGIRHGLHVYLDNVEHIHNAQPPKPGDVDLDGVLTFSVELSPEAAANADFNQDGVVSFQDISDFYIYMTSGD